MRAKQHGGAVTVEKIAIRPALAELLGRLRKVAKSDKLGTMFPNRFSKHRPLMRLASMRQKLTVEAVWTGAVERRFTFHDLRGIPHHPTQRAAWRPAQHPRQPDHHDQGL